MGDLPDEFNCTITNWEYIYGLCRDVADDVRAAEFEPDVVVALARGGWFAGRRGPAPRPRPARTRRP